MPLRFLATALFLLAVFAGLACYNETVVRIDGSRADGEPIDRVPHGRDLALQREYLEAQLRERDSLWKSGHDLDDYINYGVTLAYLGRYEEAKQVFLEIEARQPGRYATAANLGTTYELLGENALALQWIRKAVAINPDSHYGSEWLHVKILEAKIGGAGLVNTTFLLSTGFGTDTLPRTNLDSAALARLQHALRFQLGERMTFIRPKDPIVALLLFELGNVTALTEDVTSALRIYDQAKEYGFASEVLDRRYAKFVAMQVEAGLDNEYTKRELLVSGKKAESGSSGYLLPALGAVLLGALALIVLMIRRLRQD